MLSIKLGNNVGRITIPAAIHISNLILDAKQEGNVFGTVVVNTEELTFYKWGLKMGQIRFDNADLMCTFGGIINYDGPYSPTLRDTGLYQQILNAR